MQTVLLTIVAIVGVLLIAAVGLMLSHLSEMRRQSAAGQTAVGLLQQQMENLRQSQQTLSQIIDKNLQAGQQTIHQFLTHSGQTLGELKEQMGKLKSDSEQMLRIGK